MDDVDRFGYSLTYHETFKPKFTFIYDRGQKDIYKDKTEVKEILSRRKSSKCQERLEKFRHILSIKMVNTIVTNMVVRKLMRNRQSAEL